MVTIKSYTDIEQSKKLAEILPLESADMYYWCGEKNVIRIGGNEKRSDYFDIPCWSLASLLSILHNKAKDIPSLSGGGYKAGKYTSDWCLDYEFENGDYKITFADNPVDACVDMIIKLHEENLL